MRFRPLHWMIALVLFLLIPLSHADEFAVDTIEVTSVQGKALVRRAGDYLWKKSRVGQELHSGDHLQLRQGEISISFPGINLTIFGEGRIELPLELVDGNSRPWADKLVLLIGRYSVQNRGDHTLKIITSFGEIIAGPGAAFGIQNTCKATTIRVYSGQVKLLHRWKTELPEQQVLSGGNAILFSGGIDLHP